MIKLKLIPVALLLLLFLISCDKIDTYLGDYQSKPEGFTPENATPAVEVNATNQTNTTPEQEITPIQVFSPRGDNLTVYYLDVKGDAVIIQQGDHSILIDSGYEEDSEKIIKEIRNLGIETLDKIIATNTASKNIGGMPYILLRTSPEEIIDNGIPSDSTSYKLYRELYENVTIIERDRAFSVGDFVVRVIAPYDDGEGFKTDMKQNSLVVKAIYGNKQFLFMSDCEVACEERITDADLSADVIKVANSGSCDSASLTFLKKINPDYAVVSNQGEVCKDTLDRFKFLNIPLLVTGTDGDIYFTTDGLDISYGNKKNR